MVADSVPGIDARSCPYAGIASIAFILLGKYRCRTCIGMGIGLLSPARQFSAASGLKAWQAMFLAGAMLRRFFSRSFILRVAQGAGEMDSIAKAEGRRKPASSNSDLILMLLQASYLVETRVARLLILVQLSEHHRAVGNRQFPSENRAFDCRGRISLPMISATYRGWRARRLTGVHSVCCCKTSADFSAC